MEQQDISADVLEAMEAAGIPREDIMRMAPGQIQDKLEAILAAEMEGKAALAGEMLASPDVVRNNGRLVYINSSGTLRPGLVEEFVSAVRRNKGGSVTGLIYGTPCRLSLSWNTPPAAR